MTLQNATNFNRPPGRSRQPSPCTLVRSERTAVTLANDSMPLASTTAQQKSNSLSNSAHTPLAFLILTSRQMLPQNLYMLRKRRWHRKTAVPIPWPVMTTRTTPQPRPYLFTTRKFAPWTNQHRVCNVCRAYIPSRSPPPKKVTY